MCFKTSRMCCIRQSMVTPRPCTSTCNPRRKGPWSPARHWTASQFLASSWSRELATRRPPIVVEVQMRGCLCGDGGNRRTIRMPLVDATKPYLTLLAMLAACRPSTSLRSKSRQPSGPRRTPCATCAEWAARLFRSNVQRLLVPRRIARLHRASASTASRHRRAGQKWGYEDRSGAPRDHVCRPQRRCASLLLCARIRTRSSRRVPRPHGLLPSGARLQTTGPSWTCAPQGTPSMQVPPPCHVRHRRHTRALGLRKHYLPARPTPVGFLAGVLPAPLLARTPPRHPPRRPHSVGPLADSVLSTLAPGVPPVRRLPSPVVLSTALYLFVLDVPGGSSRGSSGHRGALPVPRSKALHLPSCLAPIPARPSARPSWWAMWSSSSRRGCLTYLLAAALSS
ncbi:hypothetical protein FB451DRAFT_1227443 [Mycena latifolia]|nr:hypothetical protein FB451DRAFT_1227443 [Mycena latifolia]